VNQIIPLLQSLEVTQWAGVALLALLGWLNRDAVQPLVVKLRGVFAKDAGTTEPELSAAQAFAAAELLVRYYEKRSCLEGSRAAKAAAAHLLDCPGGAA
jgi:hypothetical protein